MRKAFPILEYDINSKAIIEPHKVLRKIDIPERAVICFFNDVIDKYKNQGKLKFVENLRCEIGLNPIYALDFKGKRIALFHPGIGSPLVAGMFEEIIALGSKKFIACGGAGVLDKEIAIGNVIIPISAVRDEGTSYHYLPPSREVQPCKEGVEAIEKVLKKHDCHYILSKTWTTDAIYRETIDKVNLRKSEGCLTVEMECSALCAIAKFRNVQFAQLLYGGDNVSCEEWDPRGWNDRQDVRERLLEFAIEACAELY